MRKIVVALIGITFTAATSAQQDTPLLLDPMAGEQNPSVIMTMNVYGKCGNSVIGVIGVDYQAFKAGSLKFDMTGSPDVVVRTKTKNVSFEAAIADFNVLHCVHTPKGERLLFGSACGGSACSDDLNYAVIDPSTGIDLAGKRQSCDQACANKLLGIEYLK